MQFRMLSATWLQSVSRSVDLSTAKGERCVSAAAVCSLVTLAWATVSVTNQEHQETEMGHVFHYVWWHWTHPIMFVAHPEHKSPHMSGRFRFYLHGSVWTPDASVCRVASTTAKTWLQTTRDQHMHPCVEDMCVLACEWMCLWMCEGDVFPAVFHVCVCSVVLVKLLGMHRSTGSEQRMQL